MTTPRKFNTGDRIKIKAQFLNDANDLIRQAKGRPGGLKSGNANPHIVTVKNNTSIFQEANALLSIEGREMVEVSASNDVGAQTLGRFRAANFALVAEDPAEGDLLLCVLTKGVRAGGFAPAWIAGPVPVLIDIDATTDKYVSLVVESAGASLVGADLGTFPINFKESGTGAGKWALVDISSPFGIMPRFAEATSAPAGGTLTVKLATSDGTLVGSDLTVYDGGIV